MWLLVLLAFLIYGVLYSNICHCLRKTIWHWVIVAVQTWLLQNYSFHMLNVWCTHSIKSHGSVPSFSLQKRMQTGSKISAWGCCVLFSFVFISWLIVIIIYFNNKVCICITQNKKVCCFRQWNKCMPFKCLTDILTVNEFQISDICQCSQH